MALTGGNDPGNAAIKKNARDVLHDKDILPNDKDKTSQICNLEAQVPLG
jgi:hypothetical protein